MTKVIIIEKWDETATTQPVMTKVVKNFVFTNQPKDLIVGYGKEKSKETWYNELMGGDI